MNMKTLDKLVEKFRVNVEKLPECSPLFRIQTDEEMRHGKRVFSERFVIRKKSHPEIHKLFLCVSRKTTKLFNEAFRVERESFTESGEAVDYKGLRAFIENNPESDLGVRFYSTPKQVRLGTLYDVSNSWYEFVNFRGCNPIYAPKSRPGFRRATSVTINPNSVVLRKNSGKNKRFENEIVLPTLLCGKKGMRIPTNVQCKANICEIRVTPVYNDFAVDIRYYLGFNDNRKYMAAKIARVAAIDLGVQNIVSIATNVNSRPLNIKGSRIIAINSFYSDRLNKCEKNSNKYRRLEKRHSDKIREELNCVAKCVVDYCDIHGIGSIAIGWGESAKKGFATETRRPIDMNFFVRRIERIAKRSNINVWTVSEDYTSSVSLLDWCCGILSEMFGAHLNPNPRIAPRLFRTKNFGIIDCDVNSAYNILSLVARKDVERLIKSTRKMNSGDRRQVVFPVVIRNARARCEYLAAMGECSKTSFYRDTRSWLQNRLSQEAEPFSDYFTRKYEELRAESYVPGFLTRHK